jgi:hypothetical protein
VIKGVAMDLDVWILTFPPLFVLEHKNMSHNISNQMITAVRGNDVVLGTSSAFQHAPLLIARFLAEPVEMDVPKSATIGKIFFNLSIAATRFRKKNQELGKKRKNGTI